jgi:hypothetical protein
LLATFIHRLILELFNANAPVLPAKPPSQFAKTIPPEAKKTPLAHPDSGKTPMSVASAKTPKAEETIVEGTDPLDDAIFIDLYTHSIP